MSTPTPLAALIRNRRVSARFTQEELAEKAGVSVRTISDIERGLRRSIYRDTAERLADALEVGDAEKDDFISLARARVEAFEPGARLNRRGEPSGRGQIPVPPTSLVGREREVETLLGAFRDETIRSITLVGPGGIGKTRLATEAAVRAQHIFEGGVFFVPLSSADDSARVMPLIGEALGVVEPETLRVADIASHMAAAAILLVLDTFEHVLDAAAAVADLLSLCDRLTVLATSREPLRIRGEHVVAVPPLDLPPKGSTDLNSWASSQLLLERATAVKADLLIDEESSAVLVDICRRLDGLPLAIELAASRVRHLPLMKLRDQLDSRLSALTHGGADLPRRQRTMRATVGWSYDLLQAEERPLFRSLSVFAGGWTFEAAAQLRVASEGDVVETLSALVDKSLVLLTGAEGRAPRYSMMDVIAEFAAEQRDRCGETPELSRSHASYYLSFAESAEEKSGTIAQEDSYAELLAEHDNLRTALRWSLTDGDPLIGLRLAGALWQFWRATGHLSEGRSWLERAIRTAGGEPCAPRAKALWGACWLAFQQDDLRSAQRYSAELLEATRYDDASLMRRHALTVQAMLHMAAGDHQAALMPLERSAAISEANRSSWYTATSKLNLALGLMHLGRLDHASSLLNDALDLYARLGDPRFVARAHAYQGHLALLRSDTARAGELFCESAQRFMEVYDESGIAEALEGSAALSAATGNMEQAALLLGAATHARERTMSKTLPFERALIEAWLGEAQGRLGEDAWTDLLSRGGAMDAVEAVALATRD